MSYKTYHIYDREEFDRITNGVCLAQCMRGDDNKSILIPEILNIEDLTISDTLFCSFCNAKFDDQIQQRQHYKLDWHRYNLKQKLFGLSPITEDSFTQQADDVSSISGSESESEEDSESNTKSNLDTDTEISKKTSNTSLTPGRHAKVFFENNAGEIFSVYKCLLHSKKDIPENNETLVDLLKKFPIDQLWTVLMIGGGHFAAAVFKGSEAIAHKTFHSYTVRAKQGGSQSSRDGKSGGGSHPKSAGASLRRYNEAALTQHVQEILESWTSHIKNSSIIFYRAVGPHNRFVLFGGKSPPLDKNDSRLRTIPFATRRATYKEVKRVHSILSSIEVYGSADLFQSVFPISPNKKEKLETDDSVKQSIETPPKKIIVDTPRKGRITPRGGAIDRAKSRELIERPLPCQDLSSSSDSELEAHELDHSCHRECKRHRLQSFELAISFTESLQEFDDDVPGYLKKNSRKKPKKKKKPKQQPVNECLVLFKKKVWTACSINDKDLLVATLKCELDKINNSTPKQNNNDENVNNQNDQLTENEFLNVLNEVIDDKGNTILHRAAVEGRDTIISILMEYGSDPCNKNKKNQTPYTATENKEVRRIFRKFLTDFPDKYNYAKSQIPGPIDEEHEKKQAEKRKQLKKMKREKEKEKKKEKIAEKIETEEMKRFAALSDREKRALAAERRILNSKSGTVTRRCFLCGADIAGKVPFEYNDNCFCSMPCLKTHRLQHGLNLS
ncbi:ankyrin repeat and zinc finger domain-containing protein 1-like [Chrysoperla carnea]|uniref:ankyrin repeat and zinc finger domain-containing protein 1-like n=1 Tax=Chrysoperla carnea TaxID=189513 RepID=UPI001D072E7D|nr:ankyrin repeat and zinc finger domain-containing protein 1-like [Chrysoperla carnea]